MGSAGSICFPFNYKMDITCWLENTSTWNLQPKQNFMNLPAIVELELTVNLKGIASTRYSKYRLFRAQFLVVSWDGDQSEATHGRCDSRQAIERRVNVCTRRAKTGAN